MTTTLKAVLLLSSALVATPVLAQQQPVPPEHYTLDARSVDLVSGRFFYSVPEVAIGPADGGLTYGRQYMTPGSGWRMNVLGTINVSGSTVTVSIGPDSEVFTQNGSVYTPVSQSGATLTKSGAVYTFTTASGVKARMRQFNAITKTPYVANTALLIDITTPYGAITTYHYLADVYCPNPGPEPGTCASNLAPIERLQSITSNRGYMLHFDYAGFQPEWYPDDWLRLVKVTGINLAVDYCEPVAERCEALTQNWPSVSYGEITAGTTATDQDGRTTNYLSPGFRVRLPGSTSDDVAVATTNSPSLGTRVSSVTDATGTWNYGYALAGSTLTTTATGPLGQQTSAVADTSIGRATSVTVSTGTSTLTTAYTYDSQRRLKRVTQPEGDYAEQTYDARGNVTQTTYVAKPGSGLADLTTTASFPASCPNPVTCNRPTSTTDARGAVTNYAWNGTHGGLESATLPEPTTGATRPQTRIAYAPQTAYFKDGSGVIVPSPTAITLPVAVLQCATGASPACLDTSDEVRQTMQYGVSGAANNLLPTVMTQGNGTGTLTASVTSTYTANGDVASVDGPLPGTEDTTYYRYDTARRPVGVIGPDPDGPSGSLLRRAQRTTYDPAGRPTQVEQGVVNGLTNADWNAFNSLQQQLAAYDEYGRPVITALRGGGQAHAVTHIAYDAAGRRSCVATRMNPAAFNSLPGSACDLGAQGAYGPDRITKYEYDAASRLTKSISGYGVANPVTEEATYTANGQPLTLKDGNGNLSTMVYDGFDRLSQMRYPNASGGGSSTTDYEQYGYDAGSNLTSYRNRAGETEAWSYDALNRLVSVVRSAAPSTAWTYDNLNRPLTLSGNNIVQGFGWDALSRQTHETTPLGTMSYGYDLAGRRTRITWPDTFFIAYDFDYANELTGIRENGATDWRLSAWAYDNLGRPIAQSRGNGATTAWSYDAASRLSALTNDLAGTANDVTLNFAYNPAGQIVTRALSNSAYAYQPGAGDTGYGNNGKNQVTSVNGAGVGYDGRQNIDSVPGLGSYGYNGSNELTSATVSGTTTTLSYDPAGRLYQSGSTRFLYDGQQVVGEYNTSGGLLRRYVPGLGLDNVVTDYEGADRRYLLADERGSVVATTGPAAQVLTTNTYDEYGQPGSGNSGRFQYTGQMWLPEAQLYHYRARAYAPQLGKFMQTDPIGYAAGANVYTYVGADPANQIDPSGLLEYRQPVEWYCFWTGTATSPYQNFGGCRATDWITTGGDNGVDLGGIDSTGHYYRGLSTDFVVRHAVETGYLGGVKIEWNQRCNREQLWAGYDNGQLIVNLNVQSREVGDNGQNSGVPPYPGYDSIIHTHPLWALRGPGSGDFGKSVPVYGLVYGGAWVLRPGARREEWIIGQRNDRQPNARRSDACK